MSSSFTRQHQRRRAKAALAEARRLREQGVTSADLQRAIAKRDAQQERADEVTKQGHYPCDVCGRKSAYYVKWASDDLRRRGLTPRTQHNPTLADTWCWWHAPIQMWKPWRKRTYILFTFLLHPLRFVRVLREAHRQRQSPT